MKLAKSLIGAAVILGAVAYGAFQFWLLNAPSCTTRIVEAGHLMAASDQQLRRVGDGDRPAQCAVWRHRLEALDVALPVAAACGSSQSAPSNIRPLRAAERDFYARLVADQCS